MAKINALNSSPLENFVCYYHENTRAHTYIKTHPDCIIPTTQSQEGEKNAASYEKPNTYTKTMKQLGSDNKRREREQVFLVHIKQDEGKARK